MADDVRDYGIRAQNLWANDEQDAVRQDYEGANHTFYYYDVYASAIHKAEPIMDAALPVVEAKFLTDGFPPEFILPRVPSLGEDNAKVQSFSAFEADFDAMTQKVADSNADIPNRTEADEPKLRSTKLDWWERSLGYLDDSVSTDVTTKAEQTTLWKDIIEEEKELLSTSESLWEDRTPMREKQFLKDLEEHEGWAEEAIEHARQVFEDSDAVGILKT